MTKAAISKSMRRLPVTDRIDLVDELLHSIAKDEADIPVPNWQKRMIDERLKAIDENPSRGVPLAEFRKKLRGLAQKLAARRKSSM